MVEVREAEPPPPTLVELSTLPRIDYADAFFMPLPTAETRGAGEWVRLIFSETSPLWRSALPAGWFGLGFRLGSPNDPERIMGWEIIDSSPDFVLLAGRSRLGMPAELVIERRRDGLFFATLVQQENLLARAVWAGTEAIHRQVVHRVLEAARRSIDQGGL